MSIAMIFSFFFTLVIEESDEYHVVIEITRRPMNEHIIGFLE